MVLSEKFGNSFSDIFDVPVDWLNANLIFNPTLDVDSLLFIDPFLLQGSHHAEFSKCAFEAYEEKYRLIYKLLRRCEVEGDKLWRAALTEFRFGETGGLSGTCLGYSKKTHGAGFGPIKAAKAVEWAKEVIDLGVEDPELFSALPVFEDGIGPDLISDMVTNIALECILAFNDRILTEIRDKLGVDIPLQAVKIKRKRAKLPINPFSGDPVILVASDVLRHLPVMDDAQSLKRAAEENTAVRAEVNEHIGEIFKIQTKKDKEATKRRAMESADAFQTLLDVLKLLESEPYSVLTDPKGLLVWREHAQRFVAEHPLEITTTEILGEKERIDEVVRQIIEQFRHLIEDCRLNRTFFVNGEPRHERYAQMLFYAIAVSYCGANDIDISPEADSGVGPVDFKLSRGTSKVVVEIKLSTNQSIVQGYKTQLSLYERAERTEFGHYVVIDVGRMGKKWEKLTELVDSNFEFSRHRGLHLIDGLLKSSASKRRS